MRLWINRIFRNFFHVSFIILPYLACEINNLTKKQPQKDKSEQNQNIIFQKIIPSHVSLRFLSFILQKDFRHAILYGE